MSNQGQTMIKTVPEMLFNTVKQHPQNIALKIKKGESYQTFTYLELGEQVKILASGLAKLGLNTGDKVAILSNNRPEWPISDFAIFCLRGITVPIYQTLPPNQIEYILKDSETRAIFVENQEQFDKIQEIDTTLPNLEFIISFDVIESDIRKVTCYNELLSLGKDYRTDHPDFIQKNIDTIDPEDICSFVYTSGTTGAPKGVMLHHRGFVHDIIHSETQLNLQSTDTFLSFLPLSHLYERLAGHWCPMYVGATIHYAQSIATVIDDLKDARPNVIVSVPRIFEKIAAKVQDQVEQSSKTKQAIFNWAQKTGKQYHADKIDDKLGLWTKSRYRIAERLVFRKIKEIMGGNMRYPIAGGAPLSIETLKFFEALDMQIIEGYGMTEAHLIITLTPFGKSHYGSCGQPIEGVEVKIADDGEVLVKGPTLMAGYFKRPDLSREAIDEDGWLHTGDIGHLDNENYLYLTDRKKNILVTSGGKNVPAAPIENILKKSKYIEDVCLVGNFRKFISALIVPNYEALHLWATFRELKAKTDAELIALPEVIELYENTIEKLQSNLARFEKVKKFILMPNSLTVENGELTPSLKIKRTVIEQKFRNEIEALYIDAEPNKTEN